MVKVFGMAKSSLDLNGAKRQKLELDLLRLVYTVKYYQDKNIEAYGYVFVATPKIELTVLNWLEKYDFESQYIVIKSVVLTENQSSLIIEEKRRNAAGVLMNNSRVNSTATLSKNLIEEALKDQITRDFSNIREVAESLFYSPKNHFPANIKWDFYGEL